MIRAEPGSVPERHRQTAPWGGSGRPTRTRASQCLVWCALAAALLSGCGGGDSDGVGGATTPRPSATRSVEVPEPTRSVEVPAPTRTSRPTEDTEPTESAAARPHPGAGRRCRTGWRRGGSTERRAGCRRGGSAERRAGSDTPGVGPRRSGRHTRVGLVAAGSNRPGRRRGDDRGCGPRPAQAPVARGAGRYRGRGRLVRSRAASGPAAFDLPGPGRGRVARRIGTCGGCGGSADRARGLRPDRRGSDAGTHPARRRAPGPASTRLAGPGRAS